MYSHKYKRAYANIDLGRLSSNIKKIKEHLTPACKMCAIIKADAYGHGSIPIAREIEPIVDFYGVATLEEAVNLRQHKVEKPILVLACIPGDEYERAVALEIREAVFTIRQADAIAKEAKKQKKEAYIHIPVDTGMNRIGMKPSDESIALIKQIEALEYVTIEGIFTHLYAADEIEIESATKQIDDFYNFLTHLKRQGVEIPITHISNSAATLRKLGTHSDMVRCGISMYGISPSEHMNSSEISLEPILSLYSTVTYVKTIQAGEVISYGGIFKAQQEMEIATIPIGYADGIPRDLSNIGYVLIKGMRCQITGRICMDQIMVDVTGLDVKIGDRVTLIGEDGERVQRVEDFCRNSNTFPYEFICGLSKRIPRVYSKNGIEIGSIDYYVDKTIWCDNVGGM